jgi:hypothetical protein
MNEVWLQHNTVIFSGADRDWSFQIRLKICPEKANIRKPNVYFKCNRYTYTVTVIKNEWEHWVVCNLGHGWLVQRTWCPWDVSFKGRMVKNLPKTHWLWPVPLIKEALSIFLWLGTILRDSSTVTIPLPPSPSIAVCTHCTEYIRTQIPGLAYNAPCGETTYYYWSPGAQAPILGIIQPIHFDYH